MDGPSATVGFADPIASARRPTIVARPDQTAPVDRAHVGVGLARRFWRSGLCLEVGLEGQLAGHSGHRTCWEVATPPATGWSRFPCYDRMCTGTAFGLSFAGPKPEVDIEKDGGAERLLACRLIELEVGPPLAQEGAVAHPSPVDCPRLPRPRERLERGFSVWHGAFKPRLRPVLLTTRRKRSKFEA